MPNLRPTNRVNKSPAVGRPQRIIVARALVFWVVAAPFLVAATGSLLAVLQATTGYRRFLSEPIQGRQRILLVNGDDHYWPAISRVNLMKADHLPQVEEFVPLRYFFGELKTDRGLSVGLAEATFLSGPPGYWRAVPSLNCLSPPKETCFPARSDEVAIGFSLANDLGIETDSALHLCFPNCQRAPAENRLWSRVSGLTVSPLDFPPSLLGSVQGAILLSPEFADAPWPHLDARIYTLRAEANLANFVEELQGMATSARGGGGGLAIIPQEPHTSDVTGSIVITKFLLWSSFTLFGLSFVLVVTKTPSLKHLTVGATWLLSVLPISALFMGMVTADLWLRLLGDPAVFVVSQVASPLSHILITSMVSVGVMFVARAVKGRFLRLMPIVITLLAGGLTQGFVGLDRLLEHPHNYGVTWDVQPGATFLPDLSAPIACLFGAECVLERSRLVNAPASDPSLVFRIRDIADEIESYAQGTYRILNVQGQAVVVLALEDVKGHIPIPGLPDGAELMDDEILIDTNPLTSTRAGPRTLEVRYGSDTAHFEAEAPIGPMPSLSIGARLRQGAVMSLGGLRRLDPAAPAHLFLVRLRSESQPRVGVDECLSDLRTSLSIQQKPSDRQRDGFLCSLQQIAEEVRNSPKTCEPVFRETCTFLRLTGGLNPDLLATFVPQAPIDLDARKPFLIVLLVCMVVLVLAISIADFGLTPLSAVLAVISILGGSLLAHALLGWIVGGRVGFWPDYSLSRALYGLGAAALILFGFGSLIRDVLRLVVRGCITLFTWMPDFLTHLLISLLPAIAVGYLIAGISSDGLAGLVSILLSILLGEIVLGKWMRQRERLDSS